jgi:hypothetical protein
VNEESAAPGTLPSDTGEKVIERKVKVGPAGSLVRNAAVALSGYRLDYDGPAIADPTVASLGGSGGTDHHIDVVQAFAHIVEFTEKPTGAESTVTFRVRCEYKDRNGDDSYGGYVAVTVIADVELSPGSSVADQSATPA